MCLECDNHVTIDKIKQCSFCNDRYCSSCALLCSCGRYQCGDHAENCLKLFCRKRICQDCNFSYRDNCGEKQIYCSLACIPKEIREDYFDLIKTNSKEYEEALQIFKEEKIEKISERKFLDSEEQLLEKLLPLLNNDDNENENDNMQTSSSSLGDRKSEIMKILKGHRKNVLDIKKKYCAIKKK